MYILIIYYNAPISKTIVSKERNEYQKVLTISDIEQIIPQKIKDIFNEEDYLELTIPSSRR